MRMEIRGEFFNIFNRTRFASGGTNVSDAAELRQGHQRVERSSPHPIGAKILFSTRSWRNFRIHMGALKGAPFFRYGG